MVDRTYKRKRVPILSGDNEYDPDSYVDVPVIVEMELTGSRGQEFRYRFRNDSGVQSRSVNVKKVGGVTGEFVANADVSLDLYVNAERIKTMAFHGNLDDGKAWQTNKKLKNLDPAPKQPDGSNEPRHLKVHYVRFYRDNDVDSTMWLDLEYMDQLDVLASLAQEWGFKFRHATAEQYADMGGDPKYGRTVDDDDDPYKPMVGFCRPSLELLPVELGEDGKPVPVRLDPLRNIVNVGGFRRAYYCAVEADGGMMWSSADGKNWFSYQGPLTAGAFDVMYGNGMWIMIGNAYQSDEVFVTGYSIKSTDLFTWETVKAEGADGGQQFAMGYDRATNKFKIHRQGFYGDHDGIGEDIFVDCPFPRKNPADLTANGDKYGIPGGIGGQNVTVGTDTWQTLTNGNTFVQIRGFDSSNEIWYSGDKGKTYEQEVATTFATCGFPWGFSMPVFGDEPGTKFPRDAEGVPMTSSGSAPTVTTPLVPVGSFDRTDQFPPLTWHVTYFTQGFDASIGQGGAGIHVTKYGTQIPGAGGDIDSQATVMRQEIMNPDSDFWQRVQSGSPAGGNYTEFGPDSELCYGSEDADKPNSLMMEQCLAAFNAAIAAYPGAPWVEHFNDPFDPANPVKYQYPSIGGFLPL